MGKYRNEGFLKTPHLCGFFLFYGFQKSIFHRKYYVLERTKKQHITYRVMLLLFVSESIEKRNWQY
jgi:hypothetical protein